MAFALILTIIVSLSFALALCFHKKFEEMLPLALSGMILVLYCFGLAGKLSYGVPFVIGVSVAAAGYCVVSAVRKAETRKRIFLDLITPGFLVFAIFVGYIYLANIGRVLHEWDEFSHWGLVVKNMVLLDSFGNVPQATTYFLDYPPASALFLYFFQKFFPFFRESYLLIAQALLSISLMLPVMRYVNWKKWKLIPVFLLLLGFLPLGFYANFFATVYVDALLGLLFAWVLFTYFSEPDISSFLFVRLGVGCAVLVLTKSSGLGLALIALLLIGLDILIHRRKETTAYLLRGKPAKIKITKNIFFAALPVLALIGAKCSWSAWLSSLNIGPHFDTGKITLTGIWEILSGTAPEYRYKTIEAFNKTVWGFSDGGISFSRNGGFIFWALVFASFILVFCYLCTDKSRFKRLRTVCLGLIVFFAVYAFYLLLLYLFTYSQREAQGLASCVRYLNTFLLGAMTFLVCSTISEGGLRFTKGKFSALCVGCLVLCIVVSPNKLELRYDYTSQKNATVSARQEYLPAEQAAAVLNPETDKVYVISQDDPTLGLHYFTLRHVMTPVAVQTRLDGMAWREVSWSLGKPYRESDTQTKDVSAKEWAEELKEQYTHVFLFRVDDAFRQLYGSLFEDPQDISNNTLFAVTSSEDGILLVKVDY